MHVLYIVPDTYDEMLGKSLHDKPLPHDHADSACAFERATEPNSCINLRYLYSKVVLLYEKSVRVGIINWRIVVDEGSCLLLLVGKPVTTLTSCKLRKLITQRE